MIRRFLRPAFALLAVLVLSATYAVFTAQITVKIVDESSAVADGGDRRGFSPRVSVKVVDRAPAVAATTAPPAGLEWMSSAYTSPLTDTATAAFVWSYANLMNNWNSATGLVRNESLDASGAFDAIQSTGSLAAATAVAAQLGVVSHQEAVRIVNRIGQTLLVETPRYHGLLPHFVEASANGAITIVPLTEWSSIDTVIAGVSVLAAQASLGLDTSLAEALLTGIDWADLTAPDGMIAMGYLYTGERIPWAWDTFGGESWLVELVYAAATGAVAPLTYASPPTFSGSGFIDELAWLFVPPPAQPDYWGTDWTTYRLEAAERQVRYYQDNFPGSCFDQFGLFGLSAAEVPDPSLATVGGIYQAFGVGGHSPANDGSAHLGAPVIVPHYSAMIASLRPQEALAMWEWLIEHGFVSPWNNVESLMFPDGSTCAPGAAAWNDLKGTWNVALQALGWGRYLAEREGQTPALWEAAMDNSFLQRGYSILVANDPIPTESPTSSSMLWSQSRECEDLDESTVGQMRDWEVFTWTEPILLGKVIEGVHSLRFATEGQEFGVADLDVFTLTAGP